MGTAAAVDYAVSITDYSDANCSSALGSFEYNYTGSASDGYEGLCTERLPNGNQGKFSCVYGYDDWVYISVYHSSSAEKDCARASRILGPVHLQVGACSGPFKLFYTDGTSQTVYSRVNELEGCSADTHINCEDYISPYTGLSCDQTKICMDYNLNDYSCSECDVEFYSAENKYELKCKKDGLTDGQIAGIVSACAPPDAAPPLRAPPLPIPPSPLLHTGAATTTLALTACAVARRSRLSLALLLPRRPRFRLHRPEEPGKRSPRRTRPLPAPARAPAPACAVAAQSRRRA